MRLNQRTDLSVAATYQTGLQHGAPMHVTSNPMCREGGGEIGEWRDLLSRKLVERGFQAVVDRDEQAGQPELDVVVLVRADDVRL